MWLAGLAASIAGEGVVVGVLAAGCGVLVMSNDNSGGFGRDRGPGDGLAKGDLELNRGGGALSNEWHGIVFGIEFSEDFALAISGLSSSCESGAWLEVSANGDDSWPLREYGECPATELRLRVLVKTLGRVLSLERWELVMWLIGLTASGAGAGVLGAGAGAEMTGSC